MCSQSDVDFTKINIFLYAVLVSKPVLPYSKVSIKTIRHIEKRVHAHENLQSLV